MNAHKVVPLLSGDHESRQAGGVDGQEDNSKQGPNWGHEPGGERSWAVGVDGDLGMVKKLNDRTWPEISVDRTAYHTSELTLVSIDQKLFTCVAQPREPSFDKTMHLADTLSEKCPWVMLSVKRNFSKTCWISNEKNIRV